VIENPSWAIGEIFNAGSGEEVSIAAIAKMVVDIVGKGKISECGERNGQVARHISSTDKFTNTLKEFRVTPIATALPRVVDWYKTNNSWRKHEWMKDVLLERN
jgi:nucleoside-diphosphate-sugar epimerase